MKPDAMAAWSNWYEDTPGCPSAKDGFEAGYEAGQHSTDRLIEIVEALVSWIKEDNESQGWDWSQVRDESAIAEALEWLTPDKEI